MIFVTSDRGRPDGRRTYLDLTQRRLVLAAPSQGLRAALVREGILNAPYIHEQVNVD